MTITGAIDNTKPRIDWTRPVLWLFAACLVALIVLPMSWLAISSGADKTNHFTLRNFVTLFTDPPFPAPRGHTETSWRNPPTVIEDARVRAMFPCARCHVAMTQEDFFALGMRLPDAGESRTDYFDAELLDAITHDTCPVSELAG